MRRLVGLAAVLMVSGCSSPETEFWGRLTGLCENAYSGSMITDDPRDASFKTAKLAVSFDDCSKKRIDMFLVKDGEPYAKWVLTRHSGQLELRHIHKDGLTGYGGLSIANSSGSRMNFPADDKTKNLFDTPELEASKDNVWALTARSGSVFTYELERPGREVIFEFNTTNPVELALSDEQKAGFEDAE